MLYKSFFFRLIWFYICEQMFFRFSRFNNISSKTNYKITGKASRILVFIAAYKNYSKLKMGLKQFLAEGLPHEKEFEVLHLQNSPIQTHSIVTPDRGTRDTELNTIKNQHFFTLFHKQRVVYALEIYVYITLPEEDALQDIERIIFVSKADTTGYCDCPVSFKQVTQQLISYILSIDPNYYLKRVLPRRRDYDEIDERWITKKTSTSKALRILSQRKNSTANFFDIKDCPDVELRFQASSNIITKICLFTRPSAQYLFPKSSKNTKKHLLDGSDLLKWWLGILDGVIIRRFDQETEGTLRIPGEDKLRVARYLNVLKHGKWHAGDIYSDSSDEDTDLAAFKIPLLPDDPKSRFLHQLAEEGRIRKTSLRTFWTELQGRQEFRLGVVVSVIGVRGHTATPAIHRPNDTTEVLLTWSKKAFKKIKSYIVGEDYDTIEGAMEGYSNVKIYLEDRLNRSLIKVRGKNKTHRAVSNAENQKRTNILTSLTVRKKIKSNKKNSYNSI